MAQQVNHCWLGASDTGSHEGSHEVSHGGKATDYLAPTLLGWRHGKANPW